MARNNTTEQTRRRMAQYFGTGAWRFESGQASEDTFWVQASNNTRTIRAEDSTLWMAEAILLPCVTA
jgi:hypothetical protein